MILKRLEYDIPVYLRYAGPKYRGFEKNIVDSVRVEII